MRRYRSQTLIAHVLLAVAAFMAWPVAKPALWVMEEWGDLQVPYFVWPALFGSVGLGLLLIRTPKSAMHLMMVSFVLLTTLGGAAYLAQGWNALTVIAAVLMWHAAWTALDLKALAAGAEP